VNKDDRDDIAFAQLIAEFCGRIMARRVCSLADDSSDTQEKIEAFLFIRQR
jgi:hypothetical protein